MAHTEEEKHEFIHSELMKARDILDEKHLYMSARILEVVWSKFMDDFEIADIADAEWDDEMSDRDRYEFDMNSARYEP